MKFVFACDKISFATVEAFGITIVRPKAEEALENPASRAGAEGARLNAESLRQKDRAGIRFYMSEIFPYSPLLFSGFLFFYRRAFLWTQF